MADFPPNLEDGESWLPSDIVREIQSTADKVEDGYPETFGDNAFSYHPVHVPGIAVSPFLVPVIIASAQGAVPVLLPILYHLLPGPFWVPDPCYVGNELSELPVLFSPFSIRFSRSWCSKAISSFPYLAKKNPDKLVASCLPERCV
ncbi:hypothetical protein MLD38_024253 [Melastoma candidum]|uniref:Uncharacterized protein n=1 Tax=Melastoma candidum TaxID=119954 RepID=A0ACB9NS33_9MYRT|nr:hypothetical protein MLD38_024253 [Melastoma candidum]